MDWIKDDITYVPSANVKGIIYIMEYNGLKYIGKKILIDSKKKSSNWKTYYGSSKSWLEHIDGNEDKVTREVLYECANLVEMHYWEDYELYNRHVVFDDLYANRNVAMKTNTKNSKNFINKPVI